MTYSQWLIAAGDVDTGWERSSVTAVQNPWSDFGRKYPQLSQSEAKLKTRVLN